MSPLLFDDRVFWILKLSPLREKFCPPRVESTEATAAVEVSKLEMHILTCACGGRMSPPRLPAPNRSRGGMEGLSIVLLGTSRHVDDEGLPL